MMSKNFYVVVFSANSGHYIIIIACQRIGDNRFKIDVIMDVVNLMQTIGVSSLPIFYLDLFSPRKFSLKIKFHLKVDYFTDLY